MLCTINAAPDKDLGGSNPKAKPLLAVQRGRSSPAGKCFC
jgi:hypothetical protein